MAETGKILIIDDEAQVSSVLSRFLTRLGFTVSTADSGRQGLERVQLDRPDLVLLDIRMPGMDGLDVLRRIKTKHPYISVIMITGARDGALASASLAIGAVDYITKPIDFSYLEQAVRAQFPSPPEAEPSEPEPNSAVATSEAEPAAEEIEGLEGPSVPASAADRAEAPDVLAAGVEPVVELAAECFRLAGGLTTARLAREIEESAVGLLHAVATRSDHGPSSKRLRLCLHVVHTLGGVSAGDLARFETLCQQLEPGS